MDIHILLLFELSSFWCTEKTPGVFSDLDQQRCDCDIPICFALTFNNRTPPPYQRFTSKYLFLASRHALISPNFNFSSKRVRTHTHTRVNCATSIVVVSKCIHSVGGVIQNQARMDKSEATISMRWSYLFHEFHDREHVTTLVCKEQMYPFSRRGHQESLALFILALITLFKLKVVLLQADTHE